MSGGSMDYLYSRVRDADFRLDTPLREAFHRHLQLVAEALHDIEWVDSDDKSPGDEDAAILACIACRCAGEREAAAPHSVLVAQLLDPNEPKTEREHAAVRELTAAIARAEAAEATVERCKQVCYATAEGWRETQAELDAALAKLARYETLQREANTDWYVQTVSSHCDRIIWRGRYYNLPIPDVKEKAK